MLKKDNWILGIALGIFVPLFLYALIRLAVTYWTTINVAGIDSTILLTGIFANMFTFRYYMVNLKYDKTGRGILLATFAYAGLFVYLHVL